MTTVNKFIKTSLLLSMIIASPLVQAEAISSSEIVWSKLTFDDISTGNGYVQITNGYDGLNWNNVWAMSSAFEPGSGYANGTLSQPNTIFNGYGELGGFSTASGNVFDFDSTYITSAAGASVVTFLGYDGDTLLHTMNIAVNATTPTFVTFNWNDVTNVTFSGDKVAIDNPNPSSVPVPAAAWLFGTALAGFIGFNRRKTAN